MNEGAEAWVARGVREGEREIDVLPMFSSLSEQKFFCTSVNNLFMGLKHSAS